MKIRRLTQVGIERFDAFLRSLGTDAPYPRPLGLLTDERTSAPVEFDREIEDRGFATRLDAAKYVAERFANVGSDIIHDQGLWSWLSLFYFDRICPKKNGVYVPGERARWIPATTEHRRYYRHLLAGPYRIYNGNRDDPERAMLFLYGPLGIVGHFYYQIVSRQELITNRTVVRVATELYYDSGQQQQRRGAQTHGKPGTVFRFVAFLNQLDTTWDLYSMSVDELLERLPSEFDRFRPVMGTVAGK
ncbi:MAG: hypothetical protein WD049_03475 [Candidatus Paceibacterota bacterium]